MLTEPIRLPRRAGADEGDDLHRILSDLVQVSARVTRLANRVVKDPESIATWRTLSVLQSSGPMRVGELAALSQVAQPTMTRIVSGRFARDVETFLSAHPARARMAQEV